MQTFVVSLQRKLFRRQSGFVTIRENSSTIEDYERARAIGLALGNLLGDERTFVFAQPEDLTGENFLQHFIHDLKDMLLVWLDTEHHQLLAKCTFAVMPTVKATAFCTAFDFDHQPLPGYLVAINAGLKHTCDCLAEAIVVENLTNDLEKFRHDGSKYFQAACTLFLEPHAETLNRIQKPVEVPENVYLSIAAMAGGISAKMVEFVALHEVGHLAHGDLQDAFVEFNIDNQPVFRGSVSQKEISRDWQKELRADEFAARAMAKNSSSTISAGAHLAAITALMLWFDFFESQYNRLPLTHPPFQMRIDTVKNVFLEYHSEQVFTHLNYLVEARDRWVRDFLL
jgi:hypothetical protein